MPLFYSAKVSEFPAAVFGGSGGCHTGAKRRLTNVAFDDKVSLPGPKPWRRQALGKIVFNSGKMFSGLGQFGRASPSVQPCSQTTRLPSNPQSAVLRMFNANCSPP